MSNPSLHHRCFESIYIHKQNRLLQYSRLVSWTAGWLVTFGMTWCDDSNPCCQGSMSINCSRALTRRTAQLLHLLSSAIVAPFSNRVRTYIQRWQSWRNYIKQHGIPVCEKHTEWYIYNYVYIVSWFHIAATAAGFGPFPCPHLWYCAPPLRMCSKAVGRSRSAKLCEDWQLKPHGHVFAGL